MSEAVDLEEKPRPVRLLESRRAALINWLEQGQRAIKSAEDAIKRDMQEAIEMTAEIAEIEAALNALHAAAKKEPQSG